MNLGVIFAGGVGKRMNTKKKPKQFLDLEGKPIIIYTIEIFDNHPDIDGIVVVCIDDWIPFLQNKIRKFGINKVVKIVSGGKTGQESIYKGLCAAEEYAAEHNEKDTIVLIHDGVRPLIVEDTITDNIRMVKECGSCITVVPSVETVIVKTPNGMLDIPNRNNSMIARAPQSFYLEDIIGIQRRALSERKLGFVDSCSLMNYYGFNLGLVEGPLENIKITTPTDYFIFRMMLEVRENQQFVGF